MIYVFLANGFEEVEALAPVDAVFPYIMPLFPKKSKCFL